MPIAISDILVESIFFGINFTVKATANKDPAIPVRPFSIPSQFILLRSSIAEANIFMAPAIAIRAIPVDIRFCFVLAEKSPFLDKLNTFWLDPISLVNPTITAIKAAIAATPLPIPSQFNSANFFIAEAKIKIATDMPIMAVTALAVPVRLRFILLNIANEPINSANKTVIAPREEVSFSESINDSTSNEAAKMPIAAAILISVPALIFCCHACKASPTVSSKSFILPMNVSEPSKASVIPLIYFLIPKRILAIIPPLTTSNTDLISPLLKALPIALPILAAISIILLPTVFKVSQILVITPRKVSKPGAANFSLTADPNSLILLIPF